MTPAILRLKECQHAGIKEDDCDEMWGNLWRWENTEKYQAPKTTQNGRLILTYTRLGSFRAERMKDGSVTVGEC